MVAPPNLRARASFVDHVQHDWRDPGSTGLPVTNLIHKAVGPDDAWIEEATSRIGDWRSLTRSVYLRWAITINASELAEKRYRAMPANRALRTNTLRIVDGVPQQKPLATWLAPEAANRYAQTTPLIAAYGVADLFGALEDVIFALYEIALRHAPQPILRGEEYLGLRRIWRERTSSPEADEAWRVAWRDRYEKWQRKRAHDGLHAVLQAFFNHAGLKRPGGYRHTDIPDWCRTLEMIGELRHHVIHGAAVVSEKLGRLSKMPTSLTFDFIAGSTLDVKLHHLQSVECFCDQILTTINRSLIEKAIGRPISAGMSAAPMQSETQKAAL